MRFPSPTDPPAVNQRNRRSRRREWALLALLVLILPLLGCRSMTVGLARRSLAPLSTLVATVVPTRTPTPVPTPDPDATPRPVLDLLVAYGCSACHTIPPVTTEEMWVGPNLSNIGIVAADRVPGMSAEAYIRQSITDPNAFLAPRFDGQIAPPDIMPQNYAQIISSQEINALVEYLLTLRAKHPLQQAAAPVLQ